MHRKASFIWLVALLVGAPSATAQILGNPEDQEQFGCTVATGDFDGDGFADLAIGAPNDRAVAEGAGAVHVLYGAPITGLGIARNQFWTQDSPAIEEVAEPDDHFGSALAVGDFNGDGVDDLAIGVPGEEIGGVEEAGAVHVLYGTSGDGLTAKDNQIWIEPDLREGGGILQSGLHFGDALAAGDFNGDGFDDLAVGLPGRDAGASDVGGMYVIYGTPTGLDAGGNQFWSQATDGIPDDPESLDRFGDVLEAGDFNGDGFDDLAIGLPYESLSGGDIAGAVHVLYGGAAGLSVEGTQFWTQDSQGIGDAVDPFDGFGWSLAAGDFNGDGVDDLAIGVREEEVSGEPAAGAVNVIYGKSGEGLTAAGNQFWTQNSPGMDDQAEMDDAFGYALAAGDFNGDGIDDLAIGVGVETVGTIYAAGAVHILFGVMNTGLSAAGAQFWTQDSPDIRGTAEEGDSFGVSLAAGDFNGDGTDDLAIGVPDEDVGEVPRAGAVNVLYGATPDGPTAAGNQIWYQGYVSTVAIEPPGVPDSDFSLSAYPNPTRGRVTLVLDLDRPGEVRLAAYDALGRRVAVLADGWRAAGHHEIDFSAASLRAGAYLLRLEAATISQTRTLVVMP